MKPGIRTRMLALLGLMVTAGSTQADWGALNLPVGVTPVSRDVHALHMTIFWICVAIGVVVFGVMFYSIFRHRKSKGRDASTFHESTKVEIVWTVVPMLILVGMAVPAARTLVEMEDFSGSEMSIQVTGYQWRWHYDYLDEDIAFYSALAPEHNAARQLGSEIDPETLENYILEVDNPLVLPIDTKIRFLHTSADVIHSWWMQDFGVKKDAIPGFINENWAVIEEPGTYRGKCTELCGRDHGFMPIVVEAVTKEEFRRWVDEQKGGAAEEQTASASDEETDGDHADSTPTASAAAEGATEDATLVAGSGAAHGPADLGALVATGEAVYRTHCMGCHQREGQGIPGLFPAITGSEIVVGSLDAHVATVLHGVQNSQMAGFADRLSDAELAAVITYQRNALGNDTGDVVQADTIRELRLGSRQSALATEASDSTGVN